jgi:phosphatidylglycerol lysyltransferase
MTNLGRARALVERWGWNTTCFQIINPGIEHWFSAQGDAVVGFVRRAGVRVVAGAPVCAPERLAAVVAEFEAAERGGVCYFGAEGRLKALLGDRPEYSVVTLGAQPLWSPSAYIERFLADDSLRAQRNRARNKGVVIRERTTSDPALVRVLGEWLETRGLPTLHFLVEPFTLDHLEGRRLFVAERKGEAVGFVTLCPSPARGAWLTEQFVRGRQAPNGTIELTLLHAIETVREAEMVTMGIVPLAGEVTGPPWLQLIIRWARAHGRRFYNFGGLEWFKEKFHPEVWEPVYVISRESRFSFRTLWAVAAAFTEGPPAWALMKGLAKAVRTEAARAWHGLPGHESPRTSSP